MKIFLIFALMTIITSSARAATFQSVSQNYIGWQFSYGLAPVKNGTTYQVPYNVTIVKCVTGITDPNCATIESAAELLAQNLATQRETEINQDK